MSRLSRIFAYLLASILSLGLLGAVAVAGFYLYFEPQLPAVESLRDVQFQQPLRVYSADGELIAEYGDYRRRPVSYDEIPERMRQAVLATEDEYFYSHPGVDYRGIARAVFHLVRHQEIGPGGSTITMQVARNFFLTRDVTFLRKFKEIMLAFKIERELSKEQIFELYMNQIFFGQRAYGVGAAANIYYGRPLEELTLAESAMIAGLPQSPSAANPIANPERALDRRSYVLRRMREIGAITPEQEAEANQQPVTASLHYERPGLNAPYVAEMAREQVVARFGEEAAYTDGYRVYTTVNSEMQRQANTALRNNLLAYTERHGYRGPEAQFTLDEHPIEEAEQNGIEQVGDEQARQEWDAILADFSTLGGLQPALVTAVDEEANEAQVYLGDGETATLGVEAMEWARRYIDQSTVGEEITQVSQVVARGDLVRVRQQNGNLRLAQLPEVGGAVVSLDPHSGGIMALTGGFDFNRSQYNRAVQALRQPGSSFKPFIYAAALNDGFTPATIVNDAPVVFEDAALEDVWRPENYSGRFFGPTRLREALINSRNLVSIRVLRDIGSSYAVDFLERFGLPSQRIPANLSLALGSASITPLELARGYSVFANSGYLVDPYVVSRIEDDRDEVVFRAVPALACEQCDTLAAELGLYDAMPDLDPPLEEPLTTSYRPAERTLSPENAYLITDMMQDVVSEGTGRGAMALGRDDLAGKTGTTDDLRDAWFSGFNNQLVTTTWIGFDQARSLGAGETGAGAALPIWVDYMAGVLEGVPEQSRERPAGLVTARIDPESGLLTSADNPDAIFEVFNEDYVPEQESSGSSASSGGGSGSSQALF